MPIHKYIPFQDQINVELPDRTWPDKQHHQGPALVRCRPARRQPGADRPDDPERKHKMFDLLVRMGYKEIEVGFPSASADRLRLRPPADRPRAGSPTT